MPGLQPVNVPHHLQASSYDEAMDICESKNQVYEGYKTRRFSLHQRVSPWLHRAQWIFLVLCFCLRAGFVGSFTRGLTQAFFYSTTVGIWDEQGSILYYLACVPSLLQGVSYLMLNNVEVYEPIRSPSISDRSMINLTQEESPTYKNGSASANGIRIWTRIITNQIYARPYRLLVHPVAETWMTDTYRYLIMMTRFALLIVGSIEQGKYFLYPPDVATAQSVLLVLLTTSPRGLWSIFWVRDRRGGGFGGLLFKSECCILR